MFRLATDKKLTVNLKVPSEGHLKTKIFIFKFATHYKNIAHFSFIYSDNFALES